MALKEEQVCDDSLWRSCSLFLVGIVHSSCELVKYPYTNRIHLISRVITHSLALVIVLQSCHFQVNNYIVRSYRDIIVVADIVTRRTSKA